jgi:DNA-binding NarL/FixJ family response regulator
MTIRVLIADDQELVRDGISTILRGQPDIEVVGTASGGAQAIELAGALHPDVTLMDIRMPGVDGLMATRRICADGTSRVVILTTYGADDHVLDAIAAGASGFLVKDTPRRALIAAVRSAAEGTMQLPPDIARRLLGDASTPHADSELTHRGSRLTAREREILQLVAQGESNNDIASSLHISEATVKTHIAHLFDKLQARDRVHLVLMAQRLGLASR